MRPSCRSCGSRDIVVAFRELPATRTRRLDVVGIPMVTCRHCRTNSYSSQAMDIFVGANHIHHLVGVMDYTELLKIETKGELNRCE